MQEGEKVAFACFLFAVNALQNDCSGVAAFEKEKEWFVEADVFFVLGIYYFVFHGFLHALEKCFGGFLKLYFHMEFYCGMLLNYCIAYYNIRKQYLCFCGKVFK